MHVLEQLCYISHYKSYTLGMRRELTNKMSIARRSRSHIYTNVNVFVSRKVIKVTSLALITNHYVHFMYEDDGDRNRHILLAYINFSLSFFQGR